MQASTEQGETLTSSPPYPTGISFLQTVHFCTSRSRRVPASQPDTSKLDLLLAPQAFNLSACPAARMF